MISQRRSGTEIIFDFKPDNIQYKIRDNAGLRTFSIGYEDIVEDYQDWEDRDPWWRNAGLLLSAAAFPAMFLKTAFGPVLFTYLLALGLFCLAVYRFRARHFTVIPAGMATLLVLRDGSHDAVIEAVRSERRRYLRDKYYRIEDNGDRDAELNKFVWLRENGIITQEEFDKANIELLIS